MAYFYLKAFHIIFVVTWFAGLFYIVRLFIYHTQANELEEPEKSILKKQFKIMEKRLWFGITYPSMILTVILGFILLHLLNYWSQPFMHLKLFFVFLLIAYHFFCGYVYKSLQNENYVLSSFQLRIWNELASVFLVAIVFIIVFKAAIFTSWIGVVFALFFSVIMIAVYLAKKKRDQKNP